MSTNPYQAPAKDSRPESATTSDRAHARAISAIDVLRSLGGLVGGVLTAVFTVALLESLGHWIYPPPPGIDLHNAEALKTIIGQLPLGAIIMVLVAWGAGSLVGAFTAAVIASRARIRNGLIAGGVIMAFAGLTMIMIPHPVWFMVAAVVVIVLPAWLGAWSARQLFDRSQPAGPKPYDMREKNMAC
jgi:hypothetical protein